MNSRHRLLIPALLNTHSLSPSLSPGIIESVVLCYVISRSLFCSPTHPGVLSASCSVLLLLLVLLFSTTSTTPHPTPLSSSASHASIHSRQGWSLVQHWNNKKERGMLYIHWLHWARVSYKYWKDVKRAKGCRGYKSRRADSVGLMGVRDVGM